MRTVLAKWRTAYKLTDQEGRSGLNHRVATWKRGTVNPHGPLTGAGSLCGMGFYHGYHVPELAGFLNRHHANFPNPRLWEVQIRGIVEEDRGILKLGATEMRVVRELPYVKPTDDQFRAFAIYCGGAALAVRDIAIPAWEHWAVEWLAGRGTKAERVGARNAAYAYAAVYAAAATSTADATSAAVYAAVYAAAADAAADAARNIVQDAAAFALSFTRPTSQE